MDSQSGFFPLILAITLHCYSCCCYCISGSHYNDLLSRKSKALVMPYVVRNMAGLKYSGSEVNFFRKDKCTKKRKSLCVILMFYKKNIIYIEQTSLKPSTRRGNNIVRHLRLYIAGFPFIWHTLYICLWAFLLFVSAFSTLSKGLNNRETQKRYACLA